MKQLMIKKEIVGDLLNHLRLARQRALAAERGGDGDADWEAGRAAAVEGTQGWWPILPCTFGQWGNMLA